MKRKKSNLGWETSVKMERERKVLMNWAGLTFFVM